MLYLRSPKPEELPAVSDLMMRSKAVWGYDEAFMAACREELTLTPTDLANSEVCLAHENDKLIGMAQITKKPTEIELTALFIDPTHKGTGAGRVLFEWALKQAKNICADNPGISTMTIDADPFAAPFYRHMGAHDIGSIPSASIPGRSLPQLAYDLI